MRQTTKNHRLHGGSNHHLCKSMLSMACLTTLTIVLVVQQNQTAPWQFRKLNPILTRNFSASLKADVVTNGERAPGPSKARSRVHQESHQLRIRIGQAGLDSVRHAFNTTHLTTLETVLSQGFPQSWNPCTLEQIYQRKHHRQTSFDTSSTLEPLRITLLGGSGSARAADRCSSNGPLDYSYDPHDVYGGRYSNILEHRLNSIALEDDEESLNGTSSSWNVEITNMGQGGTHRYCCWSNF